MKVAFSQHFIRQYAAPSPELQTSFDKQLSFLLSDLRHPSLGAKKCDQSRNLWQARLDRSYRFYFQIEGDTYRMMAVIPHPN